MYETIEKTLNNSQTKKRCQYYGMAHSQVVAQPLGRDVQDNGRTTISICKSPNVIVPTETQEGRE